MTVDGSCARPTPRKWLSVVTSIMDAVDGTALPPLGIRHLYAPLTRTFPKGTSRGEVRSLTTGRRGANSWWLRSIAAGSSSPPEGCLGGRYLSLRHDQPARLSGRRLPNRHKGWPSRMLASIFHRSSSDVAWISRPHVAPAGIACRGHRRGSRGWTVGRIG
jgi:hypothetical protein